MLHRGWEDLLGVGVEKKAAKLAKSTPSCPPHAAEGLSRAGIQQVYLFLQLQDHRWDSGQSLGIFKPALRGMKAPL